MGGSTSKPLYGPSLGPSMTQPVATASSGFNSMSTISKTLVVIVGILLVTFIAVMVYNAVAAANGATPIAVLGAPSTPDQAPLPLDGKVKTVIPASSVPITQSADNGLQFWMYIKDWDHNFGKSKGVIVRKDSTNATLSNPNITLHPTDNSLNVSVSIYGSGTGAASSNPAGANSTSASGDIYTCTVENVPLQTWFAVSVTVFQRNLDVYINGKLVKSCVLPGVPRPAAGDIVVGSNGGFSGSICNVHAYPTMLGPSDAASFFSAGTNCASFAQPATTNTSNGSSKVTLFGYTFTFGVKDASGKEVQKYSF